MLIQGRPYHASAPAIFEHGVRRGVGSGYTNGGNVLKVTGFGSGQQFLGGVGGGSGSSVGGRGFVIGEGGTIGRGTGLIGADRETGCYRGVSTLSLSKPNSDNFLRVTPLGSPRPAVSSVSGQSLCRGVRGGESPDGKPCSNNNYDERSNVSTRTYNNNSYSSINADDRNSPV